MAYEMFGLKQSSGCCCCFFFTFYIYIIAAIVLSSRNTCNAHEVYFPMSSIRINLPINEKSQSIFSNIPLGKFNVLTVSNNTVAGDYLYNLEDNDLLKVNNKTGEVFMKRNYRPLNKPAKYILTALLKANASLNKLSHMSLEIVPHTEPEFCENLENICFYDMAEYRLVEDNLLLGQRNFSPVEIGSLNTRGAKLLCPIMDVKYKLPSDEQLFALKNHLLYTKVPLDHESLNISEHNNLMAAITCTVKLNNNQVQQFQKNFKIDLIDRNDNAPLLQHNKVYHFNLENPHFHANDIIGEKIIFLDKDSVESNTHMLYTIHNDSNAIVRPICNAYETDHTGKRSSIISCQIAFARDGILSHASYCFILMASDSTIDVNIAKSAKVHICLHTDTNKIHAADRPLALALRARSHRKSTQVVSSEESILNGEGAAGNGIPIGRNILSTYPKDVVVFRKAMPYYRVAQPEDFLELAQIPALKFELVEDRSGAFEITTLAGIVYVKNTEALENAPETVYFLNISWHDNHPRSFVMNVHLEDGRPANATCEHTVKSRTQMCAQIKYKKQCENFCGLATNGGTCMWRGSNVGMFGRNYASCVPNAQYCPDNLCDPLEELNTFACPQDCAPSNKIVGPHSVNDNKRGILSASGTCTCEDNGKCSCAPLDDEEPKPKRKRKNETKSVERNEKLATLNSATAQANTNEVPSINVAGFECDKSCIIVAVTCPIVFVVLIICLIISKRNFQHQRLGKQTLTGQKNGYVNGECDTRNGDLPLIELENGFKFEPCDSKWEFNRDQLVLDAVLGEGEFGKVVKGYATDIGGIKGTTTVAVKMLKNGANSVEYMALLSEFQLLQEVSHPNVIKLLGACIKGDAPMIIIEYARYGSLRSYLRLSRKIECSGIDFSDGVEPVTVKNILTFAWQICKGMAYLTEIKLVHRDLAARNVLLADGKICKISDFGLTRDVYEDDAYLKRSRDRVPVKWMAPESLADHVYTTKSDVWAFGVLCWELITLGASPYPGIPPQNLYHLLKTGYRMEKPENCSEEVYSIVRTCWTDDPNARPSFKYLASQFEKLLGNNAKYIELETSAISNPLYCSDDAAIEAAACAPPATDLTKLTNDLGEPECLDHLWRPPKIGYDSTDCPNSRDFSTTLSAEFQPPPGYDMPRPLIEATTTEQMLRYENDLRFPLNIRKSCATITSLSNIGSPLSQKTATMAHYSVPVKRGRSYMDMTNKTFIPDNLDNNDFEKHISKTISFRFSSLLNLQEQEQESVA